MNIKGGLISLCIIWLIALIIALFVGTVIFVGDHFGSIGVAILAVLLFSAWGFFMGSQLIPKD